MCHQRVRLLRLMSGLTARQTAKLLGVKLSKYLAVEEGREPLDPIMAEALAALLDIPVERICKGALPVPMYYGPPLTLEDELDEAAFLVHHGYTHLWRVQMAEDKPWSKIAARLVVQPPLPPPVPYRRIQIGNTPTYIWLNMPHDIRPTEPIIVRSGASRPMLLHRRQTHRLAPGRWVMKTRGDYMASVWFRPVVQ